MPESLAHFPDATAKAKFVREMFDRISPRYDLLNRVMTGGQDMRWRRRAIARTALPQNGRLLDIACGTGDLAYAALPREPELVVAADFSLNMVRLGSEKLQSHEQIRFAGADGLSLPFADRRFDAVVTGFSMRNVTSVDTFLKEMSRVVKPGGRVVVLEITPLKSRWLQGLFRLYFHRMVPLLGGLLGGDRKAYTYLPQSVDAFITATELRKRMEDAGLVDVAFEKLSFGTIALHWGTVPA